MVINSTEKCIGTITRIKNTIKGNEESAIEYFIVCRGLYEKVVKMIIDEERRYVLTKFYKYKTTTTTVESDQNLLVLVLSFKWNQKIKVDQIIQQRYSGGIAKLAKKLMKVVRRKEIEKVKRARQGPETDDV